MSMRTTIADGSSKESMSTNRVCMRGWKEAVSVNIVFCNIVRQ